MQERETRVGVMRKLSPRKPRDRAVYFFLRSLKTAYALQECALYFPYQVPNISSPYKVRVKFRTDKNFFRQFSRYRIILFVEIYRSITLFVIDQLMTPRNKARYSLYGEI